jgi:2-hydroxy-3-keto-5-methylthiopentenyl-1-phosphate phosphatase
MPAVLADFDGTVCPTDVGNAVCARFAEGDWRALDDAAYEGRVSLRDAIGAQTRMLRASPDEMVGYVLERFAVDPTFPALVRRARDAGAQVTVVSDGLGFYVHPMLDAAGLGDVPVLANALEVTADGLRLAHPYAHPRCGGCGTCKAQAVLRAREDAGWTAFVGDGMTDRYAAWFADVVFAKGRLAGLCSIAGVRYRPWTDFGDVAGVLDEGAAPRPSRSGSDVKDCPGWKLHASPDEGGMR